MKESARPLLLLLLAICFLVPSTLVAQSGQPIRERATEVNQEPSLIYLPFAFNRHDTQFPAPLFGVQMYGNSGDNSLYHASLRESQARWLRTRIMWDAVAPTRRPPEEYDWVAADAALAAARADQGGLNLIVVIGDGIPDWARLRPARRFGPIHPDALPDFVEFTQAVVERYNGDGYRDAPGSPVILHWEFVNEPDKNNEGWGEFAVEYAATLKLFYETVKAEQPGAQIALGGLAYDWFTEQGGPFNRLFLDEVLQEGGGNYFDIMNFHIYPLFAPNWGSQSTGLVEKTAVLRQKLASYGLNKPMIITEAGWYDDYPSDPTQQAARLMQFFVQSFAADIKVTIWWMLHDPGGFFPAFGLVTNDNPPYRKPAFTAYQAAYNLLSGTLTVRTLSLAETGAANMEAYRFQTATQGVIYVAWLNPYTTTETKPLRLQASRVTVLNALGQQISSIADLDGDGFITVQIGRQPVYLVVN